MLQATGGLPEDVHELPEIPRVRGKELQGGPQMLQLSLDGKRLYVTNSLYTPWDKQFYPQMVEKGGYLLQVGASASFLRGGVHSCMYLKMLRQMPLATLAL